MKRGRLMLGAGASASCQYEFASETAGRLRLPAGFFTGQSETLHRAHLELADGSQLSVNVTMGPRVGEASFAVRDQLERSLPSNRSEI
jgi:hypothetical protein